MPGATLRDLGEKVQQLAVMPNTEYSAIASNARAFFADVLDLPKPTNIVLVKDEPNLKHIIVPYYAAPPTAGGAELGGVVILCGCGE